MKTKPNKFIQTLVIPSVVIGTAFISAPYAAADDETKIKIKDDKIVVKTDDGKAKIEADGEVEVKGEEGAKALRIARQALAEKEAKAFKQSLVKGYVIPKDRYVYLDPVPKTYIEKIPPAPQNVTYRVFDGTVYSIDPRTNTVVGIVETDTAGNSISVTVPQTSTDVITKGYVIPKERYSNFREVPATIAPKLRPAPAGVVYRYYDGGVYMVNPQTYTVVEVVTVD